MEDNDTAAPGSRRPHRRTPPAMSHSKRDRKRLALSERLSAMSDRFQRDRDSTYRDQLQKIQYEVSVIQRFNPYGRESLANASELFEEYRQTQGTPVHTENSMSLFDMAGMPFHEFMQDAEDLMETRDFQLAQAQNEYDRRVQVINNTHAFKVETAKREHRALTSTLRDRLINTLTQKKNRLNREKEVLEINDSNALLLNPSQFSLTNPTSPGGTHGKRATRLRKEAEDASLLSDGKKRKRNPGEDDGSPGPVRRAMDPSSTTPLWQSEKARNMAKLNGPVYSIDKLFTDKELSMQYNTAAQAAHRYILRTQSNGNGSSPDESEFGNGFSLDNDDDESQPSAAAAMERQVSHATRSTRGGGGGASNQNQGQGQVLVDDQIMGIAAIGQSELPAKLDLIHAQEPPKMPPVVPQHYLKPYPRSADQNTPASLSSDEVASDLSVMGLFKQYDQGNKPGAHLDVPNGLRKLLEAAAVPYRSRKYAAYVSTTREDPELLRDALGIPSINLNDQSSIGGLSGQAVAPGLVSLSAAAAPMSRQSSQGGVAMSRQGTNGSGRGKSRR